MSSTPILELVVRTAGSVALAVLPLAALFAAFQLLFLRLPRSEVVRVATGSLIAAIGLFLFLLGVGIGFLPFGRAIGQAIASISHEWLLVPFGMILGFVTTWGEPAVRILADQVEQASAGSIRRPLVLLAICAGVAVAVGMGLFRIAYGVPLLWLLVPGYILVIVLMWLGDPEFVAVAVDAGGVATGPLANTFLLALALGASSSIGGKDLLTQGFGLVALIALAPIVSVTALGLLVRWKNRPKEQRT
ncbi:MAG TPA: DUF1538 domain-containing protein [Gammaproteobacteria bacterium]|nr:DUF1538 domain-containing protein [Gammaproteobacteria bacterium]